MEECVQRYASMVWSIVRKRCRASDAEDIVQEVFLDVWKSARRFDPAIAEEATFIAMIARRRVIDRIRSQQREPDVSPLSETNEPARTMSAWTEINDQAAHARKLMQALNEDERRVIELAVDEGLSQSQIAQRTKLPLGTVKSHARRGMMRLRTLLQSQSIRGGAR